MASHKRIMSSSKEGVIFVVISVLVVTLMFSSFSGFEAFAVPKDPNWGKTGSCYTTNDGKITHCCWKVGEETLCQYCRTDVVATGANCGPVKREVAPTPPPTQKCPENTVLGLKSKCIPLTNIPEDQQQATKQPSLKACPDGSAPDKNGKCPGQNLVPDNPQEGNLKGQESTKKGNNNP